MATKRERAYMRDVAMLGCVVEEDGVRCQAPAAVHHITGTGIALRASNFDVIALCGRHHQTGGKGVALHEGQETWERKYGTQAELVERTKRLVNERRRMRVPRGEIIP